MCVCTYLNWPTQCVLLNDLTLCCMTKNVLLDPSETGSPAEPKSSGLIEMSGEAWAFAAVPLSEGKLPRLHLSIPNWNVLYQNGLNSEFFSATALKLTENHEGRGVLRFFSSMGFIFYVCVLQAQRWSQTTATSSLLEWNVLVLKTICPMTATTQVRHPWHLFE